MLSNITVSKLISKTEKIQAAKEMTKIIDGFLSIIFCVLWYMNTNHGDQFN